MKYNQFYEIWQEDIEMYRLQGYEDAYHERNESHTLPEGTQPEQDAYIEGYNAGIETRQKEI